MVDFNALLIDMMREKGFRNYELSIEGNTNKGDGYMGQMIFFKVISTEKTYSLIMKLANKSEKLRKATYLDLNFAREIFMFTTVFSSLESFLSQKNIIDLDLRYLPKLFWCSKENMKEALVLENLKIAGFTMWEKKERLDFDHTMLVVRNLARWHGTVMAYRDQHPEIFNNWIPHLQDFRYQVWSQLGILNFTKKYYGKIIHLLKIKGYSDIAKKYEHFTENLDTFFSPASEMKDRLVITHSDCWINNVMFKFEDDKNTASDCRLLDFQLSHINTPVEDLSFFIYSSSAQSVLDNLDIVLQEYHATLSHTINSLGSNPQNIFTFNQLCDHWRKYGLFGVLSTIEVIKLKHFDEDEVPDLLKLAESEDQKPEEALDKPIRNEDMYLEEVLKVFIHFGNRYL